MYISNPSESQQYMGDTGDVGSGHITNNGSSSSQGRRSLTDECLLSTGFFVSIFGLAATGFKFLYLFAVCAASGSRCLCPWNDLLVYALPSIVFSVVVWRKTPDRWRALCGREPGDDDATRNVNNNSNDVEGSIEMKQRADATGGATSDPNDPTEEDEHRLARNNRETFMLAAISVLYLLLTIVVVPSPNLFITLLVIFFGLVAWFLAYVWVRFMP
jgi:Flp pilus assembly protein TadB